MPTKRSLWAKVVINFNYLINTIHLQASRVIPPARTSGTAVEKRDSANPSLRNRFPLPDVVGPFTTGP
jgi:hypothetical protein